jgi:hypothetical protein
VSFIPTHRLPLASGLTRQIAKRTILCGSGRARWSRRVQLIRVRSLSGHARACGHRSTGSCLATICCRRQAATTRTSVSPSGAAMPMCCHRRLF